MLSFEPHPFSYMVLAFWGGLCDIVEGLESCLSMLIDQLVPCFHCLVIGDQGWFFCCAWAVT